MSEEKPVACSLGAEELEQRVAAIGAVGPAGLISRSVDEGRHSLRFRATPQRRRRLEEIVAAEAKCCPFLDLSLTEEDGELILSIAAPEAGQATADALADAFAGR
jgi:hypothetical protein